MPYADPEQQREYQQRWMAARRAKAVELLGGKCVWCGETSDLEFDHVNPRTKDPTLKGGAAFKPNWPWARILAELAKCWLLCVECHRVKTRDDLPEVLHGTNSMYTNGNCRCDECKAAHASVNRRWRQNKGC